MVRSWPSPSGPGTTAIELPSMGMTAMRWFSIRARTTTSAPASSVVVVGRPLPGDQVAGHAVVELRGVGGEGALHVDERLERLVVDDHRLGGVLGLGGRLRHHDGDRVADEVHGVGGERGPGQRRG